MACQSQTGKDRILGILECESGKWYSVPCRLLILRKKAPAFGRENEFFMRRERFFSVTGSCTLLYWMYCSEEIEAGSSAPDQWCSFEARCFFKRRLKTVSPVVCPGRPPLFIAAVDGEFVRGIAALVLICCDDLSANILFTFFR